MHTRDLKIGREIFSIETGKLAKQADGAVVVRYGDTMVLVTACCASTAREGIDFLPLTVDYKENAYASGRIPGGFFKREGRPTEKETLTSRVIDRPLRPLFHKDGNAKHKSLPLSSRQTPTTIPMSSLSRAPLQRLHFQTFRLLKLSHQCVSA